MFLPIPHHTSRLGSKLDVSDLMIKARWQILNREKERKSVAQSSKLKRVCMTSIKIIIIIKKKDNPAQKRRNKTSRGKKKKISIIKVVSSQP